MAELETSRFVPIAGPTPEDWEGTGFRLSQTRVLTAAHVVKNLTSIWVLDAEGSEWVESAAKVIWSSQSELDVVVLETAPREGHEDWQRILQRPLRRQDRWQTFAYPRARCRPDGRFHLQGSLPTFEATDRRLEITVSEGWPDELERLKGSSGAPVLVRGELCGVLSQGEKAYEGRRLQATPINAVIDDGLLEHMDLREPPRSSVYFESKVAHLLGSDLAPIVAEAHEAWQSAWSRDPRNDVLARLICSETDMQEVALALSAAYCRLFDKDRIDKAARLYKIFHHALPSAYLLGPRHQVEDGEGTEVRVEMVSTILAEFANAAIDGRAARFVDSPDLGSPTASYHVGLPVETGIGARNDFVLDELAQEMATLMAMRMDEASTDKDPFWKFVVALASHRGVPGRQLFPRHVRADFSRLRGEDAESRREAILNVVRRRLAKEAERGCRYYVLVREENSAAMALLARIKKGLPEIRRVSMHGKLENYDQEDEVIAAVEEVDLRRKGGKE